MAEIKQTTVELVTMGATLIDQLVTSSAHHHQPPSAEGHAALSFQHQQLPPSAASTTMTSAYGEILALNNTLTADKFVLPEDMQYTVTNTISIVLYR